MYVVWWLVSDERSWQRPAAIPFPSLWCRFHCH